MISTAAARGQRTSGGGNRVAQPREVHVLAVDDVLVGVVDVVVADEAGACDVALLQRQLLEVDLLEQRSDLGGPHADCFSLQVMHTRVHGIAFRRAGAIGSPQSRQTP